MDSVKTPPFEDGGLWKNPLVVGEGWRLYRVGTCHGAYRDNSEAYEILAIKNNSPGNGHVDAMFAWFFTSCKRDKKNLIVKEVMDENLRQKLIRIGFTCKFGADYIKRF